MIENPIFIPYETKTREFDGKLLLISHLLNAGFSNIYLGSRRACKKEALNWTNGIYILKSLAKEEEEFYKKLKDNGFTLILLHVEGGIHYKDNKSSILTFFNPDLMKYIDINFVFGQAIKDDIKKYIGENAYNKSVVSGEPRFDLLKDKYKSFFEEEVLKNKKKYGNYILINTSFGLANPIMGVEKSEEYYRNNHTITKESKDLIFKKMDFTRKVLDSFLKMIEYLTKVLPYYTIIVRPHPEENISTYYDKFKDNKKVIVTNKGNVIQWILGAEFVIHYDCTTGMEAVLASKTVISYLEYENEKIMAWLPIALSRKVKSNQELGYLLSKEGKYNFPHEIDEQTKQIWFNYIHNVKYNASEIIVMELTKYIKNYSHVPKRIKDEKFSFYGFKWIIKKLISPILVKSSSQLKFGNLSSLETSKKLLMISKIDKLKFKIKIKKINSYLLKITGNMI